MVSKLQKKQNIFKDFSAAYSLSKDELSKTKFLPTKIVKKQDNAFINYISALESTSEQDFNRQVSNGVDEKISKSSNKQKKKLKFLIEFAKDYSLTYEQLLNASVLPVKMCDKSDTKSCKTYNSAFDAMKTDDFFSSSIDPKNNPSKEISSEFQAGVFAKFFNDVISGGAPLNGNKLENQEKMKDMLVTILDLFKRSGDKDTDKFVVRNILKDFKENHNSGNYNDDTTTSSLKLCIDEFSKDFGGVLNGTNWHYNYNQLQNVCEDITKPKPKPKPKSKPKSEPNPVDVTVSWKQALQELRINSWLTLDEPIGDKQELTRILLLANPMMDINKYITTIKGKIMEKVKELVNLHPLSFDQKEFVKQVHNAFASLNVLDDDVNYKEKTLKGITATLKELSTIGYSRNFISNSTHITYDDFSWSIEERSNSNNNVSLTLFGFRLMIAKMVIPLLYPNLTLAKVIENIQQGWIDLKEAITELAWVNINFIINTKKFTKLEVQKSIMEKVKELVNLHPLSFDQKEFVKQVHNAFASLNVLDDAVNYKEKTLKGITATLKELSTIGYSRNFISNSTHITYNDFSWSIEERSNSNNNVSLTLFGFRLMIAKMVIPLLYPTLTLVKVIENIQQGWIDLKEAITELAWVSINLIINAKKFTKLEVQKSIMEKVKELVNLHPLSFDQKEFVKQVHHAFASLNVLDDAVDYKEKTLKGITATLKELSTIGYSRNFISNSTHITYNDFSWSIEERSNSNNNVSLTLFGFRLMIAKMVIPLLYPTLTLAKVIENIQQGWIDLKEAITELAWVSINLIINAKKFTKLEVQKSINDKANNLKALDLSDFKDKQSDDSFVINTSKIGNAPKSLASLDTDDKHNEEYFKGDTIDGIANTLKTTEATDNALTALIDDADKVIPMIDSNRSLASVVKEIETKWNNFEEAIADQAWTNIQVITSAPSVTINLDAVQKKADKLRALDLSDFKDKQSDNSFVINTSKIGNAPKSLASLDTDDEHNEEYFKGDTIDGIANTLKTTEATDNALTALIDDADKVIPMIDSNRSLASVVKEIETKWNNFEEAIADQAWTNIQVITDTKSSVTINLDAVQKKAAKLRALDLSDFKDKQSDNSFIINTSKIGNVPESLTVLDTDTSHDKEHFEGQIASVMLENIAKAETITNGSNLKTVLTILKANFIDDVVTKTAEIINVGDYKDFKQADATKAITNFEKVLDSSDDYKNKLFTAVNLGLIKDLQEHYDNTCKSDLNVCKNNGAYKSALQFMKDTFSQTVLQGAYKNVLGIGGGSGTCIASTIYEVRDISVPCKLDLKKIDQNCDHYKNLRNSDGGKFEEKDDCTDHFEALLNSYCQAVGQKVDIDAGDTIDALLRTEEMRCVEIKVTCVSSTQIEEIKIVGNTALKVIDSNGIEHSC